MQYLITFNHQDDAWEQLTAADQESHMIWLKQFMEDLWLEQRSKLVFLAMPEDASHVRKHADGRLEDGTGPAIPGPEQMGGYYLVEVDTQADAMDWARRGRFLTGANEVRAVVQPFG